MSGRRQVDCGRPLVRTVWLCDAASGCASVKMRAAAAPMRVATWNLENLFAPPAGAPTTIEQAYEAKLATLSATISALAPDVLAVQEIGPPPAIDDLAAALSTTTGDTWHLKTAAPDGRGIRVGLLARHPLRDVEQVTAFPAGLAPVQIDDDGTTLFQLGRPALEATVSIEGRDVHVVSVHLKSKLLSFPGGRFSTSDEDERGRYAVLRAAPTRRRGRRRPGLRHHPARPGRSRWRTRRRPVRGGRWRLQRRRAGRVHPDRVRATRFGDRDRWVRPTRRR